MKEFAVLVTAYNRPSDTRSLLEIIGTVRPNRLYLFCDGPKADESDWQKVEEVRTLLKMARCSPETFHLFLSTNRGPRVAISAAISWFFSHESEGVILEDDCQPRPEFFDLAHHFLERHRDDKRIWGITGSNTAKLSFAASYGFIHSPLTWGWATWADRWALHDPDMPDYLALSRRERAASWPSRAHQIAFSRHIESILLEGRPDTWDYQWAWTVMKNRGLWAVSASNMVENVGFGKDATNKHPNSFRVSSAQEYGKVIDPMEVLADPEQDFQALRRIHGLQSPLWLNYPINYLRKLRKAFFKRYL